MFCKYYAVLVLLVWYKKAERIRAAFNILFVLSLLGICE